MVDFLYFSMIAIKTSKKKPSGTVFFGFFTVPIGFKFQIYLRLPNAQKFKSHPTHSRYLQSDPLYLPDQD